MTRDAESQRTGGGDGTGAGGDAQDDAFARTLAMVALGGWSVLTLAGGAIAIDSPPGGRHATTLMVALLVAPFAAVIALMRARGGWGGPARLTVGACVAFVAWSGLSIAWADAPDLAWLATNRVALACVALTLAFAVGRTIANPIDRFAMALTIAGGPVLVWALGSRIVPDLLAPFGDTPRLSAPFPPQAPNALALVAALTIPGAAVLIARRGPWASAGVAVLGMALTVAVLTQSRGGLLTLLLTIAMTLWLLPARPRFVAAVATCVVATAPAVVFAFTADALTREPILAPPDVRRTAGLVFGLLIVAGVAAAVLAWRSLIPMSTRVDARWIGPHGRRIALIGVALILITGVFAAVRGGPAASTGADRVLSVGSNNRVEWWREALAGFADAPVAGHGAGSFPLTHLRERDTDLAQLRARQPHQLALEALTELGLVGLMLGAASIAGAAWAVRRLGRSAAPAAIVLGAFLLQSQLDWTWTIPGAALPAVAAAGVLVAAGSNRPVERRMDRRAVWLTPVAVAICASAILVWASSERAREAAAALNRAEPDLAQAITLARSSADLNPTAIFALLTEAQAQADLGNAEAALRAARRAATRQPDNPASWECLAHVAAGDERAVARSRVRELDPRVRLDDPAQPLRCRGTG